MTSTVLHDFKQRVEAFLTRTGMSPATFGRLAINDGSFVADMREGRREFRLSTIDTVDQFMAAYVPAAEDADEDPVTGRTQPGDGGVKCEAA